VSRLTRTTSHSSGCGAPGRLSGESSFLVWSKFEVEVMLLVLLHNKLKKKKRKHKILIDALAEFKAQTASNYALSAPPCHCVVEPDSPTQLDGLQLR